MGNVEVKQRGSSKHGNNCCPIIPFKPDPLHGGHRSSETVEDLISQMEKEKLQKLSSKKLKKYTSGFSHKIGAGGFGHVYKGQFPNRVPIAVKVLNDLKEKDALKRSFIAEVGTIGRTRHTNLVKLYGFCYDSGMIALVYEFVEHGSLDKILYDNHLNLDFEKLYDIAIKTGEGIAYLHEECDKLIIHYDIKPANVLIDSSFRPKVADFGLAKLCNVDSSHVTLAGMRGTPGFIAPELRTYSPIQVTYKCDVYSFGVMLFEFLRRKKNDSYYFTQNEEWFPDRVWRKYKQGQLDAVLTECGIEDKNREKAKTLCVAALLSAQYEQKGRPFMSTVVGILKGDIGYEGERETILASTVGPSGFSTEVSTRTSAKSSSLSKISSASDGILTSDKRQLQSDSTCQKSAVEVEKQIEEEKYINVDNVKKKEVKTVVLKVHGDCDSSAQKFIMDIEGVETVEVDLNNSLVTVRSVINENELAEYVRKKLNKPAEILKDTAEKTGEDNIAVKSDKRSTNKQPNMLAVEGGRVSGEKETELKKKVKKKLEKSVNITPTRAKVMPDDTEEGKANVDTEEKKRRRQDFVKRNSNKKMEEKMEEDGIVKTKNENVSIKEEPKSIDEPKINEGKGPKEITSPEKEQVNENMIIKRAPRNVQKEKAMRNAGKSEEANPKGREEGPACIVESSESAENTNRQISSNSMSNHQNEGSYDTSYGFSLTGIFSDDNPNGCSIQ